MSDVFSSEETVEEHRKLERMLRQVNAFRTGRKSPRVPVQTIHSTYGKYYSSAEEYSSESDESQYDVERSKDLSPRILYGREETHRVTALTDRPRYVRRPHGGVVVEIEEPATDSSDESDTGKPSRSSKLLYKPTHGRRDEQVSEVIEETNDTVISSMTLDRKINLEKQIKRPGEIYISPDGRYRSRRQVHVTPGPQKGDVSMVYLQITTAKSTQDAISPTADNRQSRGIQLDIETIPVDAKDVLYVEPRVVSWQKNAAGGMTLKHDVSLDPIQLERERRSVPERTMEAIVSGAARTGDHYERGVQMTSRDEYEGIMKPPMFNYVQRSTQTTVCVEPEKVVEIKQAEEVHAAPPVAEIHFVVSSFTEASKVTIGLISSGLILEQADTSIAAPKSEISNVISTITQEPVKKFVSSTIGVSTEQLLRLEDAWTEAAFIEKEPDDIIKEVRMVGEKSAPPVEPVSQPVKVRPCQTAKPLVRDFEIQSEIDTQRMESITHLSEESNEVVITSGEIKKAVTLPVGTMTDLVIQTEREQVVRNEPALSQRTQVASVVTSWVEASRILEEISSDWSTDITDRGISAPEIAVASIVTSSEKAPKPQFVQMNVTTETESEYVSRGTETMVVEEMMPVIRQEKTLEVKAEPVVQPRVMIRYCQSATPFSIHYEGITTNIETQTKAGVSTAESKATYVPEHLVVVTEDIALPPNTRTAEIQTYTTVEPEVIPALRPRMHSIELQAQISAGPLETKTYATEEQRVQLEGIGISTDASIMSLDAWTETVVTEEPVKQIVPEGTVVVKAEPAPKRVMRSMEIQARLPSAMFIQSVECPSILPASTASMTYAMIESAKPVVVHTVHRPAPELETTISTSAESRLVERGISTESMVTYLDAWTETVTIEEPAKKPKIHSTQLQAQIAADILETITHATEEQRVQLEGIGISTEALMTCLDAWTEAGIVEEPARLIKPEHTMVVKTEPVKKPIMQSVEIQAVMAPQTAETISVIGEKSRAMTIVSIECLPRASVSSASMTDAMIEPAKPVVVHSVPPSRPLTEQISSGRTLEYTDVSTDGPVVELETGSTSVETRLEEIGISTEALIKCQDAWTEILLMEEPVHQIEPERTTIVRAEPVMKPVMHTMEIQAVTKAKTMETTTQIAEFSKRMVVVTVESPVIECRSTSIMTEAMIEPAKPVVVHSVPQTQIPVEVISTERSIEQADIGTVAAIPEYVTTATSRDESGTRQSEIISSVLENDMATTVSTVIPAHIPDVVTVNKGVMTEVAPARISRRTETILVEEPMPVIQPDRVVEVRESPPISLEIETSQTLLQSLSEGIFTKFEEESVRPITLSAQTQTVEPKAPYEETTEVVEVPKEVFTISSQTEAVSVHVTATMTELMIEPAKPTLVHSIPPAPQKVIETETIGIQYLPEVRAEEFQVVGEVKEKPITLSVASQVDLISSQMEAVTHISEIPRPDYRSIATTTETMVEPTSVAVQAIQPPQPSSMTTSSELYLKQIDTAILPQTMELSTTVSSIPRVSVSSLGIATEPMAVQVDGWTQADYVEPEPVIQPHKTVSTVETTPPVQPTKVRIGSLQSPYQIRYEGITSEVEVKEPLGEVEISAVQCLAPAKVILETATSQYIYVPERREAVTEEMAAPKAAMRTYEVQVSPPQAEMISSALEVSQADVGIPAPERIVGVCRGVETITIEEPVPIIKPERVVEVREAPPIVIKPEPVKVKYLRIQTQPMVTAESSVAIAQVGDLAKESAITWCEGPQKVIKSTATITENLIEPTKPVVVHSIPPTRPQTGEASTERVLSASDAGTEFIQPAIETTVSSVPEVKISQRDEEMQVLIKTESEILSTPHRRLQSVEVQALRKTDQTESTTLTTEERAETISSVLGPQLSEVGIAAKIAEVGTVLSSVAEQPAHKVQQTSAGIDAPEMEIGTVVTSILETSGVSRGTETLQIEEPLPIIKPERVVEVREAPPIVIKPEPVKVKYLRIQTQPMVTAESSVAIAQVGDLAKESAITWCEGPQKVIKSTATITENLIEPTKPVVVHSIPPTRPQTGEASTERVLSASDAGTEFIQPAIETTVSSVPEVKISQRDEEMQVLIKTESEILSTPHRRLQSVEVQALRKTDQTESTTLTTEERAETISSVLGPQLSEVGIAAKIAEVGTVLSSVAEQPAHKVQQTSAGIDAPEMEIGTVVTSILETSGVSRGTETLQIEEPLPIIKPERVVEVREAPPKPVTIRYGPVETSRLKLMDQSILVNLFTKPLTSIAEVQTDLIEGTIEMLTEFKEFEKSSAITSFQALVPDMNTIATMSESKFEPTKTVTFYDVPQEPKRVETFEVISSVTETLKALKIASTGVTGPKRVDMGTIKEAELFPSVMTTITQPSTRSVEVTSGFLGPEHEETGIEARESEFMTTQTSVTELPARKIYTSNVGIATEPAVAGVSLGTETIAIEEAPTIKAEIVEDVKEAPPLMVQPLPFKIRYGKTETPIQVRHEVIHEQPVKLESMMVAKAGIQVTQKMVLRSIETVISTRTINSSVQTDLAVGVRTRAVSTGEVIESLRSPKLTTKSGYVQVQSSIPVYVKPQTEEKHCSTESIPRSEKSVQFMPMEEPKEVIEVVVVTAQTKAFDVKTDVASEHIEKAKERAISSAVFEKPLRESTSTMTEMLIEPTKPTVVFSTPPLRQPITIEVVAAGCVPHLIDTGIDAPIVEASSTLTSKIEEVVEPFKQTYDVLSSTLTTESHDRGIQTQIEILKTEIEVIHKSAEMTSGIGGPALQDEGTSVLAEGVTSAITSMIEAPAEKILTNSVGITTEAAPVGISCGTETITVEEPIPIIKPEKFVEVRKAPPVEHPQVRYGSGQTAKVPKLKVECTAVGIPMKAKPVMKFGEVQTVQEIPLSEATSSSEVSVISLERVQVCTVAEIVEKPKEVVSAIPIVPKQTSVSSLQVSLSDARSTATITESRIEPSEQVIVHAVAPAQPLEIASTGSRIEQRDIQIGIHKEELPTAVTTVIEQPIRPSEVTTEVEAMYSDSQITVKAVELRTVVSSWAEMIVETKTDPVEAAPPWPMAPLPISVRYSGIQTPGMKHIEAIASTEPTEYHTLVSGRVETVVPMKTYEVQSVIEEKVIKPAMTSTEIQTIEKPVTQLEVLKPSVISTEWIAVPKDISLTAETPSTIDVGIIVPAVEIHTVLSSAYQAEPEPIVREVATELVPKAALPTVMRIGKMQTQPQQYGSTATMTSHEFTPTKPEIVTISKPKVSDVAVQVFITTEIQDTLTPLEVAKVQVEVSQVSTTMSSHVEEEKRIAYVKLPTETPIVDATATTTEVRIEPAQPVVVHSVPPAPESISITTGLSREHIDVETVTPVAQISSTISSVTEAEKPKIIMRSASIETERAAPFMSTGTETQEAVQIIKKESVTVVKEAPPIPFLTPVKFGKTETEVKLLLGKFTDTDKVETESVSVFTDTTTISTEVQAVVPEVRETISHISETPKIITLSTATMTEHYMETESTSYVMVQTDTGIAAETEGTTTTVSSVAQKEISRRAVGVVTKERPAYVDVASETVATLVKYAATQIVPALKGPEHVHTSTMTTEEIAPKKIEFNYAVPPAPVLPDLMDSGVQTQKASVSESLTMTEVTKQKSINLQTEEEFIWEEEIPTLVRLKCLPVETIPAIKKNSNIQCSIMESPPESIAEEKEPEEFAYEEVEVAETTYKFTDTQVTETMTKKVPLIEWAGFAPSTGFINAECSQEFYELFTAVRKSVWERCVTEELEEYFANVGYAMLNPSIYEEILSRRYLKEYAGQTQEAILAEVGLQFPYETAVQEPFEYEVTTKTKEIVEESYISRLRRGVISESETYAILPGTDFEIQVRMEPEQHIESPIRITEIHESFAYEQPPPMPKVISLDQCEQTDFELVSTTTYHEQKTDFETSRSEIRDVVHVLEEPVYVKTQVHISNVTEGSQTEPLSYDYLSEMLKQHPRPQPGIRRDRHDCLHDLDITTYFFDEDALEEEYYQRVQEIETLSPLGEPITERMPIEIRQRVVEYELCDMTTQIDARDWDNIREVASPITGLFAPVSFAVRQGWIQLGGRNEYVDPATGHAIPLETALAQGRIRLAAGASTSIATSSSLMYIERESIAQETVEAIFVLNTVTREYIPIRQAQLDGLIREDINHITWVLNKIDNVWLTAEEAISQNILRLDRARNTETEEEVRRRQLQSVVRAYHVTAVRPGGEPSEWLRPEDAVRMGLFDRQTGKIAVDWHARPSYQPFEDGRIPPVEEGVSLWCNFLTARQAGWIRLIPEMNINKWIPLSQPSGSSGNRRLLSTAVNLVSSSKPNQDQLGSYRMTSYERTRHFQSERGQYTSYTSGSMAPHRLGSDSHSPDYGTEDSRTPPYLTEVGEFEHTEVYTLPSHQVAMEERIPRLDEVSSFRTLEEGDGQFYSYPATTYTTEESMSTVRHEFEEMHSYADPSRGQYIGEQSPSVWSRGQVASGQRIEPPSDYSRSGYVSRSSEVEQRR
ncbi:hypothetical protein ACTXT7_008788 [Hymenolepis weldensis]